MVFGCAQNDSDTQTKRHQKVVSPIRLFQIFLHFLNSYLHDQEANKEKRADMIFQWSEDDMS